MPEALTIDEFISDTIEDVKQPLKSKFISKISSVRCTVYQLDESLESHRNVLIKAKKLFKTVVSSGVTYAKQTNTLCEFLEHLGQAALESNEPNGNDIATSLCKFSVIHRDLANMTKQLMHNLNSVIIFPMETFMQGDVKSDFKKPFEKALKDYEYRYDKLRKEKLQVMKETGVYTPELFTDEMTKDLEKERRRLQLETCEYFIKVNDLKAKCGADLIQQLIDFFYIQTNYLRECLDVLNHFGKSMTDLVNRVNNLHKLNKAQKQRLTDTREEVKRLLTVEKEPGLTYTAQPTQTNRALGTRKSGYLLKKSDGMVKRVWQRRRVHLTDGELLLYHADESKPPVRLALLTCRVKLPNISVDMAEIDAPANHAQPTCTVATPEMKLYFDLVSNSRTYNFQAEDEQQYDEWINILHNAIQEEFNKAMNVDDSLTDQFNYSNANCNFGPVDSAIHLRSTVVNDMGDSLHGSENDLLDSSGSQISRSHDSHLDSVDALSMDGVHCLPPQPAPELKGRQLRSAIQSALRNCKTGNEFCADCGRPDPEWVSVNLGVLICLECCGAHRELGVHYSRTQSLLMDKLSTNQLLLPRFIGNCLLNEVFESSLPKGVKPSADPISDSDSMNQRRAFIRSKYVDRRFITRTTSNQLVSSNQPTNSDNTIRDPVAERYLRRDLLRAVKSSDLGLLLQVFAEGFDLMTPFHADDDDDDDDVGDVLSTGGGSINPVTSGQTALHLAVENTVNVQEIMRNQEQITTPLWVKQQVNSFNEVSNDEDGDNEAASLPVGDCTNVTKPYECRTTVVPCHNLPIIEFIIQNTPFSNLKRTNELGDTALHHAARLACVDALKLLIQVGGLPSALVAMTNRNGQTPSEIINQILTNEERPSKAQQMYKQCLHILQSAEQLYHTVEGGTSTGSSSSNNNNNTIITNNGSINCNNINMNKSSIFDSQLCTNATLNDKANLIELIDTLESLDWGLNCASTAHPTNTTHMSVNQKLTGSKLQPAGAAVITTSSSTTTSTTTTTTPTTTTTTTTTVFGTMVTTSGARKLHHITSILRDSSYTPVTSSMSTTTTTAYSKIGHSATFRQGRTGEDANMFKTILDSFDRNARVDSGPYHSPLLQRGHALATLPRKKGPAPRPPSVGSQQDESMECAAWRALPSLDTSHLSTDGGDNIEVILDMLEEKPAFHLNSKPDFTATPTPPTIPPKPLFISSHLYSTLPNRQSAQLGKRCSSSVSHYNSHWMNRQKSYGVSDKVQHEKHTDVNTHSSITTSVHKFDQSPDKSELSANPAKSPTLYDCGEGNALEAMYDCEAENEDELTFRRGDLIRLINRPDDDWWEGSLISDPSQRGMFPVTYVKLSTSKP